MPQVHLAPNVQEQLHTLPPGSVPLKAFDVALVEPLLGVVLPEALEARRPQRRAGPQGVVVAHERLPAVAVALRMESLDDHMRPWRGSMLHSAAIHKAPQLPAKVGLLAPQPLPWACVIPMRAAGAKLEGHPDAELGLEIRNVWC